MADVLARIVARKRSEVAARLSGPVAAEPTTRSLRAGLFSLPVLFVLLWSTGFIATKYVLHNAEPLTYLAIRMALVVGLMAVIVAIAALVHRMSIRWLGARWPSTASRTGPP